MNAGLRSMDKKDRKRLAEEGIDDIDIRTLRDAVEFQEPLPGKPFDSVAVYRPLLDRLLNEYEELRNNDNRR